MIDSPQELNSCYVKYLPSLGGLRPFDGRSRSFFPGVRLIACIFLAVGILMLISDSSFAAEISGDELILHDARSAWTARDYERARSCAEKLYSKDPGNSEAGFLYGAALCKLKKWGKAIDVLEKVPAAEATRTAHYHLLGVAYLRRSPADVRKALAYLQQAHLSAAEKPGKEGRKLVSDIDYLMGFCHFSLGSYAKAVETLLRVHETRSPDSGSLFWYTESLRQSAGCAEVLETLARYPQVPRTRQLLKLEGECQLRQENYQKVVEIGTLFQENYPNVADGYALAARALLAGEEKDPGKAVTLLDKALSLDEKNAEFAIYRAEAKELNHDYDGARLDYERGIERRPDVCEWHVRLGICLEFIDQKRKTHSLREAAIQSYERARDLCPDDERVQERLKLLNRQKSQQ